MQNLRLPTRLQLPALLVVLAMVGAACGAAFAVSGEQVAEPIQPETSDSDASEADESAQDATGGDAPAEDATDENDPGDDDAAEGTSADDAAEEAAVDTSETETETETEAEATPDEEPVGGLGVIAAETGAFEGEVLFGPAQGASQYLIANSGEVTQSWTRFGPGQPDGDAELLPNGLLLRSAPNASIEAIGASGRVELVDQNGSLAWSCTLNESWFGGQHFQGDVSWIAPDAARGTDPWGSLLLSAYVTQSGDRIGTLGKNLTSSDRVYVDSLIELVPNTIDDGLADAGGSYRRGECGTTVWEWRATDRIEFDATDLPVPGGVDWTTFSSIAYSPDLDMVAVAASGIGEVWVIDHAVDTSASSTDSVSAELLSRYSDIETPSSVSWAGGLLLVVAEGTVYSIDLGADEKQELFDLEGQTGFAEQLPNGNLLITDSDVGRVVEIDGAGIVWEFISPVVNDGTGTQPDEILPLDADVPSGQNRIGRAYKYPTDYAGLD